jgi:dihydroorotate dehydrogenase electron transfer subunit
MYLEETTVLYNREIAAGYFRLGLACSPVFREALPGQFVMLRPSHRDEPLLNRPFSIHRLIGAPGGGEGIEILYKVVGRGTRIMASLRPEAAVSLFGPLGRGFSIRRRWRRCFLVSGGIGVAPMLFLALRLREAGAGASDAEAFIGGRTEGDLLCRSDFEALGIPVHLSTDDGSLGMQCLVTDPLTEAVAERPPDVVYACGPMEMLRCIAGIVGQRGIPCQVSVEAMMACGMGACLGCALEPADPDAPYRHACLEGPVFFIDDLKL